MIAASIGVTKSKTHGHRAVNNLNHYESNHKQANVAERINQLILNILMIGIAAAIFSVCGVSVPPQIICATLGWATVKSLACRAPLNT
jgi:hypothetical protein